MKKSIVFVLMIGIFLVFSSCDSLLANSQGLAAGTSSYNGGGGYYTSNSSSTRSTTSSSKEWRTCTVCNGSGQCRLCHGSGTSMAKDRKCHTCDRKGNGKCAGCKERGGWYI